MVAQATGADELIKIASTLGADVAFFVFAHFYQTDAVALGIGDKLTAIELPQRSYLLLLPKVGVSTAKLFTHPHLTKDKPVMTQLEDKTEQFLDKLSLPFYNAFEPIVTASEPINQALEYLRTLQSEADGTARLTGTGSAVFLPMRHTLNNHRLSQIISQAPCPALMVDSLYGYLP